MLTSRGCPYQCVFCGDSLVFKHNTRLRTPENVVDEIEYDVREFGVGEISIVDSIFTLFPNRVTRICEEIISRGLEISWFCNARVDTISAELLRKMKKAGCHRIYYGIESGSQGILI